MGKGRRFMCVRPPISLHNLQEVRGSSRARDDQFRCCAELWSVRRKLLRRRSTQYIVECLHNEESAIPGRTAPRYARPPDLTDVATWSDSWSRDRQAYSA